MNAKEPITVGILLNVEVAMSHVARSRERKCVCDVSRLMLPKKLLRKSMCLWTRRKLGPLLLYMAEAELKGHCIKLVAGKPRRVAIWSSVFFLGSTATTQRTPKSCSRENVCEGSDGGAWERMRWKSRSQAFGGI